MCFQPSITICICQHDKEEEKGTVNRRGNERKGIKIGKKGWQELQELTLTLFVPRLTWNARASLFLLSFRYPPYIQLVISHHLILRNKRIHIRLCLFIYQGLKIIALSLLLHEKDTLSGPHRQISLFSVSRWCATRNDMTCRDWARLVTKSKCIST